MLAWQHGIVPCFTLHWFHSRLTDATWRSSFVVLQSTEHHLLSVDGRPPALMCPAANVGQYCTCQRSVSAHTILHAQVTESHRKLSLSCRSRSAHTFACQFWMRKCMHLMCAAQNLQVPRNDGKCKF